jgi:hypothetical protein
LVNFSIERHGEAVLIKFAKLPYWKGVSARPGLAEQLPFSLGWDSRGFIRQRSPKEVQKKVVGSYADEEYSFITPPPGASAWANRLAEDCMGFVRGSYGSLLGKRVLDIGAGSPYVGDQFTLKDGVVDYVIMDPGIKHAAESSYVSIVREYFSRDRCPSKKFDLILSLNCLEHVEDPVVFLTDIQVIAKESSARVVLIFPDNEQQFRNGDFNALLHEHLSYFTMSTATALFERCGFRVVRSESQFDCLCFLLDPHGSPRVEADTPQDPILALAAENFEKSLRYVSDHLRRALAVGQRVALHGSTNGLNNALYLAGLESERNLVVFDGDESKAGKYLPANPNPIRYSGDAEYKRMDHVFIAALTFYPEIYQFLISKVGMRPEQISPILPLVNE